MKTLCELAFIISTLCAVNTLILMLAPDRYRREIKAILSLILAACVIASVINADFSEIANNLGDIDFDSAAFSQDEAVKRELEDKISGYISTLLQEKGITCKNISVATYIDDSRRISITKASLWLSPGDREKEQMIAALINEKIGNIEKEFHYEDE